MGAAAGTFLYLCLKLAFQHPMSLGAAQGQDSYEIRVGTSQGELRATLHSREQGRGRNSSGTWATWSCLQASEPRTRIWAPFPEELSTAPGAGESLTILLWVEESMVVTGDALQLPRGESP